DGEGDRVHAPREVGRYRLSAGPSRRRHPDSGKADGAGGRLRRHHVTPPVSRADVTRPGRRLHRVGPRHALRPVRRRRVPSCVGAPQRGLGGCASAVRVEKTEEEETEEEETEEDGGIGSVNGATEPTEGTDRSAVSAWSSRLRPAVGRPWGT